MLCLPSPLHTWPPVYRCGVCVACICCCFLRMVKKTHTLVYHNSSLIAYRVCLCTKHFDQHNVHYTDWLYGVSVCVNHSCTYKARLHCNESNSTPLKSYLTKYIVKCQTLLYQYLFTRFLDYHRSVFVGQLFRGDPKNKSWTPIVGGQVGVSIQQTSDGWTLVAAKKETVSPMHT